jgi:nitroreductase
MDLYKLMENRRSTRDFSTKNVSREKLDIILKATQFSPSGANQKPFAYIVIDDSVLKKKIKGFCESADENFYKSSPEWLKKWMNERNISLKKNFLVDAPYLIAVAGETDKPYWLESTWISIAYLILAAENEGLSTLTYTPSETNFLKDLLSLPKNLQLVCLIPIGYSRD